MEKLQELIEKIKVLETELTAEIQKKEEEFFYKIRGKKVRFDKKTKQYHKTLITKIHTYLWNAKTLNILTAPVTWFCLIPAVFLDLVVTAYQYICFPINNIPKVRRSDYIVIDRFELKYLNALEKVNCVYCGYFNGLMAYVQEIGARSEQRYCPIKHARKVATIHSRYKKFLEFGDADSYKKELKKIRSDFEDIEKTE
jgi:hypothetical protein